MKRIFLPKTCRCIASSYKRYHFKEILMLKYFWCWSHFSYFVLSILVWKLILETCFFSWTKFMKSITTRLKECLNIIYPHLLSPPFYFWKVNPEGYSLLYTFYTFLRWLIWNVFWVCLLTIIIKMMEIKTQNTSYFIITMDRKINDVLSKIDCYVKI